ncbi:hypothetical protein LI90_4266 [Carbonactinospora thermoautotrophica]|uniref:Uncharacterized protein n=2 Tax=Carbonactinospora thermoautotrophica TaxID=1469144 RepID=A0A132MZ69_9ACTN|nr:hypothetical protein LI90_4266 [Carbonactinospora thermoautotrophica]
MMGMRITGHVPNDHPAARLLLAARELTALELAGEALVPVLKVTADAVTELAQAARAWTEREARRQSESGRLYGISAWANAPTGRLFNARVAADRFAAHLREACELLTKEFTASRAAETDEQPHTP